MTAAPVKLHVVIFQLSGVWHAHVESAGIRGRNLLKPWRIREEQIARLRASGELRKQYPTAEIEMERIL